jgi:glycosyltransferase involved in cell wall biosynthesis
VRILIATDAFPPNCGGSGWSTWELVRGLTGRGHDVTVVQPRPGTARGERPRHYEGQRVLEVGAPAPDVPYVRNYFKNEWLSRGLGPTIARIARQQRAEILHAQHVLTGPATIDAARNLGRPSVCTVRDYWPVCYWADLIVAHDDPVLCPACSAAQMTRCVRPRAGHAWPLALPFVPYMRANLRRKRAALARADAVIAVSRTLTTDLRARAPELQARRLETIPNPVNLADAQAARSRPAPVPGTYAAYVGKLAPNKGTRWLVDVARRSGLPWPLVIIGDGPDRPAVEAAAADSGLDIRVLGWRPRDEALTWLAHAAIVVFPSFGPESLSRVLLEGSAAGCAIAAMDTGGTRDIIEPDRTGLLSATPDGLARDMARLVADPALRVRLGAAARAHVETTFESTRVVDRIEALYCELIETGATRRG